MPYRTWRRWWHYIKTQTTRNSYVSTTRCISNAMEFRLNCEQRNIIKSSRIAQNGTEITVSISRDVVGQNVNRTNMSRISKICLHAVAVSRPVYAVSYFCVILIWRFIVTCPHTASGTNTVTVYRRFFGNNCHAAAKKKYF